MGEVREGTLPCSYGHKVNMLSGGILFCALTPCKPGGECGRLNMGPELPPAPQDVSILIPRTCEYSILNGKRDFADVMSYEF